MGSCPTRRWGHSRSSRGDSRRHPSSPCRVEMGLPRWTPMRARGKSGRCCCNNNPTSPLDPWAIGVAPSTRPGGTTARRSGSASRWCGPPFSSVPTSRGRASRCARTTRHSSGRASGALRRRLLLVDVAVPLVLLAAAHTTGGHTGLAEKDRAGVAPTQELKQLLHLVGRDPGVVTGPLRDRVTEGDHGVAQAGHQGPRHVTAELPGVAGNDKRQPLRNAIRGDVVQLVEGGVGDVTVFHGVKQDNGVAQGVAHGGGGMRGRRRRARGG